MFNICDGFMFFSCPIRSTTEEEIFDLLGIALVFKIYFKVFDIESRVIQKNPEW